MKKITYILSVVLLAMGISFTAYAAQGKQPSIRVKSEPAHPGETLTVTVSVVDNPGIIAARLNVSFSKELTLVRATNGSIFEKLSFIPPKKLGDGSSVASSCNFVWQGVDVADKDIKNGTVLTLKFKIADNIAIGKKCYIMVSGDDIIDKNMNTYDLSSKCEVAAAHNTVVDKAIEPTCTKAGKTSGSHCSVCDTVIIEQKPIEKTPHSYATKTTKATTSANGKMVKTCSMCGKKSATTIAYPKILTLSYTTKTYTGKALKPTVIVKDSAGKVISSTNYTVTYKNNTKVGKATVTITFKGNYTGTITKTFTITPNAVTGVCVISSARKTAKITFTKATGATGYEIYYSIKKSSGFKKLTTTTKTSYTYSKLTSGKTYYFKVRAYTKLSDGTKFYGAWSSVVSKKIK